MKTKRMCNRGRCGCKRSLAGRRANCRYFSGRCRALSSRSRARKAAAETGSGNRTKPHRAILERRALRVVHDLDCVPTFGGMMKLIAEKNPGFMARLAASLEAK